MINTFVNGGLNIPHFETFCKSLKVTWVKRYILGDPDDCQWIKLINFCLRSLGGKFVFRCNLEKTDVERFNLKSTFWKDVLKCWCEYNYTQKNNSAGNQIIWLNSRIRVDNKTLYHAECIENQLHTLKDLYYETNLLDRNIINMLYDVNLTIMEYNSIISAIPREWKFQMSHADGINEETSLHNKYNKLTLMSNKYVSKIVYSELISNVSKSTNLQEKWSQYITDGQIISNKCFTYIYSVTIDNILRSFQYKLLHRILFFNDKLYVFNMVNTNICEPC